MKNGLLPVVLSDAEVTELMNQARARDGYEITVNLEARLVRDARGFSAAFDIGDFQRNCLLNGLDDIGITLQYETDIAAYENVARASRPWAHAQDARATSNSSTTWITQP